MHVIFKVNFNNIRSNKQDLTWLQRMVSDADFFASSMLEIMYWDGSISSGVLRASSIPSYPIFAALSIDSFIPLRTTNALGDALVDATATAILIC